jgi:uroporphyrinogen decarboxylase
MNSNQNMTDRERFAATMHYKPVDRCPICDFGFWDETVPEWHKQGLPEFVSWNQSTEVHTDQWFGMDAYQAGPSPDVFLSPYFDEWVLEDLGDHEIVQQGNGVRVLRKKYMGSIPHHVGHLLTDRDSWERHYKHRFDPSSPARYPSDWEGAVKYWCDPTRDKPVSLPGGSLFGWLRDLMGLENVALVPYDDPAWFEEMVSTLADCTLGVLSRVLETGAHFDSCSMWEDMCYSGGPLLSPDHFKRFLVPHYRRITDLLHKHGVDVVWLDCDGKIDALIPLWLEGGVNCMFPIEVGTWKADPAAYRKEYGRDLLLMGGFDKHVLQGPVDGIRREIERLLPLVEDGGYIPMPDHRVPPDVPYSSYLVYLREARRVWGKDLNLKLCPALETSSK